MDAIFKALNDPARRALLDSLRKRDGQTLTELEEQLSMSRFGVMKHLKVLESAQLIVTQKKGRFKYHYLNPLPLQEVIDRWIEPLLAKPTARAVLTLKNRLEKGAATMTDRPDFVHQTIIRTDAQTLWDALLDGEITRQYYFNTAVEGRAEPGKVLTWRGPDGAPVLSGQVIDADPPRRLNLGFEPHFMGPNAPKSRHVFLIDDLPGACRLTIEHYDLPNEMKGIRDGWVLVTSRLKTLLETGKSLDVTMDMLAG
ncbi:ArsR/SmtB family transcription factor [Halovulum sp. GXIMD14793]